MPSTPRISHAAVNYRPRIVGAGLFGVIMLTVPADAGLWVPRLAYAFVFAGLWPHFAYWRATRRSASPNAELHNVLVDALLGGVLAAILSFRLWPLAAICSTGFLNSLIFGGPRFFFLALASFAVGGAVGALALGFDPHFETEPLATALSFATILGYVILLGATAYRLRRRARDARRALEHEERQSQRLLSNVFPDAIVPRLRAGESPIADQFADVTVVFADIVGFTPLAERLGPKRTVLILNELFAKFDQAATRHGIEKIETTGDGYLAVGGAPSALDDHPGAAAAFSLELLEAARNTMVSDAEPVQVRVGIHTGPVLAGVIGESRFHYKVFGETVNVASRVQSECKAGRVLVSETTWKRIRGIFPLEEHAVVELKGHGPMRTYWLLPEAAGVRGQALGDNATISKRA